MSVPADIQREIINHQHLSNTTRDGDIIDENRLVTLWRIIVEENDSQLHLVSDGDRDRWVSLRDSTEEKLAKAVTPEEITSALRHVAAMIISAPSDTEYRGYQDAIVYDGVAHVPEEKL